MADEWRKLGYGLFDVLQPGRSEKSLARAEERIGRALPHEARVWWGWHDGVRGGTVQTASMHGLYWYGSLERQLESYELLVKLIGCGPKSEYHEECYPEDLFPILHKGARAWVTLDLDVAHGEASPVRFWGLEEANSNPPPIRARSFGEMVEFWIELMRAGAYRPNDGHYYGELVDARVDAVRTPLEREQGLRAVLAGS